MKTISKILSIVLALSMVMALCLAASAETAEVKICDFENAETDFQAQFAKNGRNTAVTSVTSSGYKGSLGLKYEIGGIAADKTEIVGRTQTANHYNEHKSNNQEFLKPLGFNTQATPNKKTDILWFWIDYNVSTTATVCLQWNGKVMVRADVANGETYSIYTLEAQADGTNKIVEVPYNSDVNTHGVSIVDYNTKPYDEDSNAYLLFKPGFEGWVGLPNDWLGDGNAFSYGSASSQNAGEDFPTTDTLQLLQLILLIQGHNEELHGSKTSDLKIGDHFVLDELCFTPAGTYPKAADTAAAPNPGTPDEPSKTADAAALVPAMLIAVASAAGLIVVLKKKEF